VILASNIAKTLAANSENAFDWLKIVDSARIAQTNARRDGVAAGGLLKYRA
jgi:hypothetical protein